MTQQQNNLVLTDTQKLEIILQKQQTAIQEDIGNIRETINTLCNAMQDLVDKLALQGTPTRPTSNPSAKIIAAAGTTLLTQSVTMPQAPARTIKVRNIEELQSVFPKEIFEKLDFSLRDAGTLALIKPIAFLGSEIFSNVNNAIRAMGGIYVSAGRESHFEVPLSKQGA